MPGPSALVRVAPCPPPKGPGAVAGNAVAVTLAAGVEIPAERWKRAIAASSACGLCGKVSIEDVQVRAPVIRSDLRVPRASLLGMPATLRASQRLFAETGGLHAAGLFTPEGKLVLLREDVGRHNTVDKVVGHFVRTGGWPPADHVLLVSGRAGFEILQKACVARIPVVAAVGAPSSLAVDLAVAGGVTLVAFLRDTGFGVYAHPERIVT